jgi:hypothetical protein
LKIVDVAEVKPPEEKSKKIIKLLLMKGEDIKSNRLCEPVADATIEGAKSTVYLSLPYYHSVLNKQRTPKRTIYIITIKQPKLYTLLRNHFANLMNKHSLFQNSFSKIADYLPGKFIHILRSQNENL